MDKKVQELHQFMNELKQDPNMNPNIRDENMETPLLIAIDTNQTDIVQSLLNHPRIKVNLKDDLNCTPLYRAIYNYQTDIVLMLLEHPRIDPNVVNGPNPRCNTRAVQNDDHNTVLYLALDFYRMDMLRILLKHPNLNVNKKQLFQKPLLHLFVEGDFGYDIKDEDCIELFNIMIENPSFDVNILFDDQTALDRACLINSPEWVHRLLLHSSLEDVQGTYDKVVFNADDPTTHTNIPEDENWANDAIVSILNNFIEKEQKEDRYLTEKFCMSMIQPFVHTQLKRRNPLYIGPDLIKDISSYLQWSDISKKSKKEMKIYFEDFPIL